jgi:DNA-binding response OmpR family regulator
MKANSPRLLLTEPSGRIKKRILIIDDDIDLLSLLNDVFSYNEFEVNAQLDPILALKDFRDNPKSYDLVILDIWLGGSSEGLNLYSKLKEANVDVKIFVFTALELDIAQFTRICPLFEEHYLIKKPIPMHLLVEKINSELN